MSRALIVALDEARMRSVDQAGQGNPTYGADEEVLPEKLHKALRRAVRERALYKRAIDAVICSHDQDFPVEGCDGCTLQLILARG